MKTLSTNLISPILVDPSWISGISQCIESTGTTEFSLKFFDMITQAVSIEQCIIFTYHTDDKMNYVMAENSHCTDTARNLANDYVSGPFRKDPNFTLIQEALENDDAAVSTLPSDDQSMPSDYLDHFFRNPDLVDKVSLTSVGDHTCYYINLYRGKTIGKFRTEELATLNFIAPILSSLVLKNFSHKNHEIQEALNTNNSILEKLSARERQVCELILRGYTLKLIANELEISETSAATYRKRAYLKLGIPSKGKLVALCAPNKNQ